MVNKIGYSIVEQLTKNRFFITWKIQCKLPPKTKRFCPLC